VGRNSTGIGLRSSRPWPTQAASTLPPRRLPELYGKVSKDLDELERTLGHQLFERSNRGLELTAVGEDILRSARSMADSVQTIIDCANDRSPTISSSARAKASRLLAGAPPPELLSLSPTSASVPQGSSDDAQPGSEGDGDIAIQFEQPSAANVVSRQLGWLHYILYAAPSYCAARRASAMSDLQAHAVPEAVRRRVSAGSWRAAAAWGAILPNTMETDAGTILMEACASGAGIAALPSYVSQFDDRLTPLTHIKPLASLASGWPTPSGAQHGGECSPCCTGSGRALIRCATPVSGKSMCRPNAKTMIGRH
jgi:DNA-binding transcriptional LysR family regulator